MVSQHERARLAEAFKRERFTGAGVVLKCVAGLLVVAGLAVVGALPDTTDATAANQPRSAAPSQAGVVSQMLSANAADTRNPNQKSGFTQRGASPVNLFHN